MTDHPTAGTRPTLAEILADSERAASVMDEATANEALIADLLEHIHHLEAERDAAYRRGVEAAAQIPQLYLPNTNGQPIKDAILALLPPAPSTLEVTHD